jgi:hypothetical protein
MTIQVSRLVSSAIVILAVSFTALADAGDRTAAYLAARDRYIAEFKARPADDPSDKRMDRAFADLEGQLKTIIAPWHAPGFPAEGRINLSTLDHQDMGFGALDGLRYETKETAVIVTTPVLVRNWIADHNRWWSGSDDIPQPVGAAIRSEQFWTYAEFDDSAKFFFGEVPVKIPGGTGVVLLAVDTQTGIPNEGPRYILVAVLRDDRIFVASQKLETTVPQQPVCERQLEEASSYPNTAKHADRDFQACFAPHLHEQPRYGAIRKQAQALVDLLH